jgi:hypothetical protein
MSIFKASELSASLLDRSTNVSAERRRSTLSRRCRVRKCYRDSPSSNSRAVREGSALNQLSIWLLTAARGSGRRRERGTFGLALAAGFGPPSRHAVLKLARNSSILDAPSARGVPIALVMLSVAFRHVPESRDRSEHSTIDWRGRFGVPVGRTCRCSDRYL